MTQTNNNEHTIAIRLRAYERLTLLLERITPNRLVDGLELSTMSTAELQQALLLKLKTEFDYNLSQQIYVSDELWDEIEQARDQMAGFCLSIQQRLQPEANAMEYAQQLAKTYRSNGPTPIDKALEDLKREVREIL